MDVNRIMIKRRQICRRHKGPLIVSEILGNKSSDVPANKQEAI